MKKKFLIFGATGAVGSSLTKLMKKDSFEAHLIGKNESEISKLSSENGFSYSLIDVLDNNFIEKLQEDLKEIDIAGIAYCVGSIDLKPVNLVTKKDYLNSFALNFFPIVDVIRKFQDNLKKNKSSVVLFSTVAVRKGFTNHAIISSAKGAIEGLTVSLAAEFAPNIRVNCVAPSLTDSKMSKPILKSKLAANKNKQKDGEVVTDFDPM